MTQRLGGTDLGYSTTECGDAQARELRVERYASASVLSRMQAGETQR